MGVQEYGFLKQKMKTKKNSVKIRMVTFSIGDKVEVIDDTTKGEVVGIDESIITIAIEEGFQLIYHASELVKTSSEVIAVTNSEIAEIKVQKEIPKRKNTVAVKPKERSAPAMEVDLHINQLVKSTKNLGNYEILTKQMEVAKYQLEFAIRKRIQKVVFIHGVGEGVLKEELYYLFKRYDNIKFYDANYQKYGLGATEVYIYQHTQ